jgi:DNA-binding transcriptional LysR family regulator
MPQTLVTIAWARKLKLRHLEVFLTLHETGGLTAAAAQLHMTQPALSHWLADLEDVVGRPLFVRGRRLALTAEGEVLRAHATRMLGDVERTDADLKAVQAGLQGRVHVGTGMPRVLLPRAIARLQEGRPGVFVSVVEAPLPELLEKLAKRDIDVVIGALGSHARASGFATEVLIPDTVQVVARHKHPLLRKKVPRWEDLLQYPWILPPVGSVMGQALDGAFAAQHLQPPLPRVEANSSLRVHLLSGETNYLSVLSASEADLHRPLGVFDLPLQPEIPFPDIGAIWEADRAGALLGYFLDALRLEAQAKE